MVLQCYDFLTDSAIPTDRYLLLYGSFSWEEGVRRSPEGGGHLYEGGGVNLYWSLGRPILVRRRSYIGRDDDLYRIAKKAI